MTCKSNSSRKELESWLASVKDIPFNFRREAEKYSMDVNDHSIPLYLYPFHVTGRTHSMSLQRAAGQNNS